MSFLPVLIIGGALILMSGKKKKRKDRNGGGQDDLPESTPRGEIFKGEDPPDLIVDEVGERFSIMFQQGDTWGTLWRLESTLPGDSVKFIAKEYDDWPDQGDVDGGSGGDIFWIFEAINPGEGSIVFHLDPAGPPPQPPAEVVEIKTKIS